MKIPKIGPSMTGVSPLMRRKRGVFGGTGFPQAPRMGTSFMQPGQFKTRVITRHRPKMIPGHATTLGKIYKGNWEGQLSGQGI
jgi:hypothetical protein